MIVAFEVAGGRKWSPPLSESGIGTAARIEFASRLATLLEAYQRGDTVSSNALVDALNPLLYRFFRGQSGNAAWAEDLTQECWIRIHRARSSYRPGEPALPWLFAIARHTWIDHYRKAKSGTLRETAVPERGREPSVDPRETFSRSIEASNILSHLDTLPPAQREVFLMLKVGGLSVEEVALATGSSRAAIKQKAWRACEALRRMFQPGGRTR